MSEKDEEVRIKVEKVLTTSYSIDAIFVRSPIKYLTDTIKEKRFLEGLIVSVMYFERFGIEKLQEYFKSKNVPLEPMKVEDLRLPLILRMLEGFGIISQPTHSLMGEVCKERNNIVHKLKHPDAIDENRAKKAIEKAIECLKALGVS